MPRLPPSCLRLGCGLACSLLALSAGSAPPTASRTLVIDSCVSPATLSFRPGVDGVMLDAPDAALVGTAILEAYPVIQRDGLVPTSIALWRKPKGPWLYATLSEKAHAPHPPCFTATVAADRLAPTPLMLRKYFGAGP
jgi:hypothetical protein